MCYNLNLAHDFLQLLFPRLLKVQQMIIFCSYYFHLA